MEENWEESGVKNALRAGESKSSHAVVQNIYDARGNGDGKTCPTITGDHENRITDYTAVAVNARVRRLTPLECERLQGYPDGWTDIGEWMDSKGKRHQTTDSARYKALGNSIALPYWRYLLKRISAQFEYTPTMASLFDGIGGFPYLWEGINGKGTCLWASEIEEFPIAVTKMRIGGTP
jgi:DNA (cytosine-5)-methyltransferase 1